MTVISAALLGLTLLALTVLVIRGQVPERCGALFVAVYLVAVPLLEGVKIHEWRMGVALAEFGLFLGLWWLAERHDRWWLTAAAGFQLISAATFLFPIFIDHFLVWTGVAVRLGAWVLVLITLFFAAWETHLVRRHGLETSHG